MYHSNTLCKHLHSSSLLLDTACDELSRWAIFQSPQTHQICSGVNTDSREVRQPICLEHWKWCTSRNPFLEKDKVTLDNLRKSGMKGSCLYENQPPAITLTECNPFPLLGLQVHYASWVAIFAMCYEFAGSISNLLFFSSLSWIGRQTTCRLRSLRSGVDSCIFIRLFRRSITSIALPIFCAFEWVTR